MRASLQRLEGRARCGRDSASGASAPPEAGALSMDMVRTACHHNGPDLLARRPGGFHVAPPLFASHRL
eukprot:4253742-Pyramimonas_sp.AAC.1